MPCDVRNNINAYNEVWAVIEPIIDSHLDINHVILCGDINMDINRQESLHTKALLDFNCRLGLQMCIENVCFTIPYTYENVFSGVISTIDHFIVCENMYPLVKPYCSTQDGGNLSDHNPVFLSLTIAIKHVHNAKRFVRQLAWSKASSTDIELHKQVLQEQLMYINIPLEDLRCKDYFCVLHRDAVEAYHNNIVSACISASKCCIPVKKKEVARWTEHVQPFKEQSIFWHHMWRENGCPRNGWFHDIMVRCKAKYKKGVKVGY